MRGLRLLAHYAPRELDAWPGSICPEEHHEINQAREWLAAGDHEGETQ
jgi:hypothetical protein